MTEHAGVAKARGKRSSRRRTSASVRARGAARGKERGSATLATCEGLARRRFGIRELRPEQREVLRAVLAGRDALAVLPTGFGKSLCYQLPALVSERPTLVVSPLVALMADQEAALRRARVDVVRFDGTLRAAERRTALERIAAGGQVVVLTTPESLQNVGVSEALAVARPGLLCVDEAHCISEWGHDFRPAYLGLGEAARELGIPTTLALTATATPRVRADVVSRLGLRRPARIVASPHRPNLALAVRWAEGHAKPRILGELLRTLPRPAIVYCATTVQVERIARALAQARMPSAAYHGRLPQAERAVAQKRFMKPKSRMLLVATSAFGMGVDKPDVRSVLHAQAPASLEQYAQEAGRAGRDGRPARCVLLFDERDLDVQRRLRSTGRIGPEHLRRVARALRAWAGEERSVLVTELALSAGVPRAMAGTICAELEAVGALTRDARRRYHLRASPRALRDHGDDLARRFHTQQEQDEERLLALRAYAETQGCRAAFLRGWFGDEDAGACGTCDRCRPGETGRALAPRRRRGQRMAGEAQAAKGNARDRRRRRGGRRRRADVAARPRATSEAGDSEPSAVRRRGPKRATKAPARAKRKARRKHS